MKKLLLILSFVLILSGCSSGIEEIEHNPEMTTRMVFDENKDFIYYDYYDAISLSLHQLIRQSKTTGETIIIDESWCFSTVSVVEDDIYYVTYRDNGKDFEVIHCNNTDVADKNVLFRGQIERWDNWLTDYLYIKEGKVYFSNSDKKLWLYANSKANVIKEDMLSSAIYNNILYYTKADGSLYEMDLDTAEEKQLVTSQTIFKKPNLQWWFDTFDEICYMENIIRTEKKLYFLVKSASDNSSGRLFSCNLNGNNLKEVLPEALIRKFDIYKDKIYFIGETKLNGTYTNGFYVFDKKGKINKIESEEQKIPKLGFMIFDSMVYFHPMGNFKNAFYQGELVDNKLINIKLLEPVKYEEK